MNCNAFSMQEDTYQTENFLAQDRHQGSEASARMVVAEAVTSAGEATDNLFQDAPSGGELDFKIEHNHNSDDIFTKKPQAFSLLLSTSSPLKNEKTTPTSSLFDENMTSKQGTTEIREREIIGEETSLDRAEDSFFSENIEHVVHRGTFESDGLFSSSLADTPTPATVTSNLDLNAFSSDIYSNAAFESALLMSSDGYLSGMDFSENLNVGFNSPDARPVEAQYSNFPVQNQQQIEAFPLPSYLQAHLDETYTASTLIFPSNRYDHNREGNVFFQVTAYRQKSNQPAVNTPPALCRSNPHFKNYDDEFDEYDKENVVPSASSYLTQRFRGKDTSSQSGTNKARSLPLRKHSFMNDSELEKPLVARKTLIRHNMPEDGAKITCNCNKSRCLKLYCDCFQNGKVCTEECGCIGCKNTLSNSGPRGIRTKTITEILQRRPDAFDKREKKIDEGCKCKKNKCLKKYCVCYNVGTKCDPKKCRCLDCHNYPGWEDDMKEEGIKPLSIVEVPMRPRSLFVDVVDSESASSSGISNSDEEFIIADKRIHNSKRYKLWNNPQDDENLNRLNNERNNEYFLGLGSPSHQGMGPVCEI